MLNFITVYNYISDYNIFYDMQKMNVLINKVNACYDLSRNKYQGTIIFTGYKSYDLYLERDNAYIESFKFQSDNLLTKDGYFNCTLIVPDLINQDLLISFCSRIMFSDALFVPWT